MITLKGNLLALADTGLFDVICHGCNIRHTMGAGIALQIARRWPEAKAADDAVAVPELGRFSRVSVRTRVGLPLLVYNLYTQPLPGPHFEALALSRAMTMMKLNLVAMGLKGCRLAFPAIGGGLGGGNWDEIMPTLRDYLGQYFRIYYVQYVDVPTPEEIYRQALSDIAAHALADPKISEFARTALGAADLTRSVT